jgi:thioredoxin reductase (NADPH)
MLDGQVAFPTLDGSEIAAIETLGSRRSVAAGEYLYREGDARYDFYVVVSGAVEIMVHGDGEERTVARFKSGQFLAS